MTQMCQSWRFPPNNKHYIWEEKISIALFVPCYMLHTSLVWSHNPNALYILKIYWDTKLWVKTCFGIPLQKMLNNLISTKMHVIWYWCAFQSQQLVFQLMLVRISLYKCQDNFMSAVINRCNVNVLMLHFSATLFTWFCNTFAQYTSHHIHVCLTNNSIQTMQ